MSNSILDNTKKQLGMPPEYTEFDPDIIMTINSALSNLTQIGVGPEIGFEIEDNVPTWQDLTANDPRLSSVKNYVWLYSRLMFDPPPTSFGIQAIKDQLDQMLWRIEVVANPAPPPSSYPAWAAARLAL